MRVISTSFLPDDRRAFACDRAMVDGLRQSLLHVAEAVERDAPAMGGHVSGLADVPGVVSPRPETFGAYYDLVDAIMAGDEFATRDAADTLRDAAPRDVPRLLVAGQPGAERLVSWLAADKASGLDLAPVPDLDARAFAALLEDGRSLMARELPMLAAEIDIIVNSVLLGHSKPGSQIEFDGASHYKLWGLLILNPRHHPTPLAVVEVLAHEAAHSLLFGLTVDEPLVLNPDSETYASPLRRDPRPMDGIFHATFVSARMAWAMEQLAASPRLSMADRALAAQAAATDRQNFAAGDAVVRAHGRLTQTGMSVLDAARAWIAA
jgi:HEXXH motif-containing protein